MIEQWKKSDNFFIVSRRGILEITRNDRHMIRGEMNGKKRICR